MGVGHIVDANTFALWRFDETAHQTYTTAADETGNYDATQATDSQKPTITGGPNGLSDYARWFNGVASQNQGMDFTSDATMQSTMTGNWTVEAWIYIEELGPGFQSILSVNGSGETPGSNYLGHCKVSSGGKLGLFWEHGSGVNEDIIQAAGATLVVRTWTYVAITASVSGATRTVNFFIDSGTSQDSGAATNADGGTTTVGYLGYQSDSDEFHGAIARIRLSNVVRTGTELNDNATDTTFQFANDGSTVALWDFQEVPEIKDISGNGYHLAPINKGTNQPRITDSLLLTDGGRSRSLTEANEYYILYQQEPVRLLLLGEYTIEWWGQLQDTALARGIVQWGGSGETEATNFLIQLSLEASGGNYTVRAFWEYGAGINVTATGVTTVVSDNTEGVTNGQQRHHYAVVFKDVGGGNRDVLIYRDGTLVETVTGGLNPTGGTTITTTNNGLDVLRGGTAGNLWEGFLDDMRISNVARTATEVLASYNRGAQTTVRSLPALPRTT